MTKPSYEEHDCGKYCDSLREKIERQRGSLDHSTLVCADLKQKLDAANRELARVRGLLQRGYHLVNVAGSCADEPEEVGDKWMEEVESELKTGAESADIGKPPETAAGDFELDFLKTCGIKDHIIREGDRNTQLMLSELLSAYKFVLQPSNYESGSAETGGEKAAHEKDIQLLDKLLGEHQEFAYDGESGIYMSDISTETVAELRKRLATFPRPSQNQTVSSGVEGAHEGTTADKSVALAESSLSSPPSAGVINVTPEEPL